jgi:hypothetical protein
MNTELLPLVVGAADPAEVTSFWRTVLDDEAFERHLRVEPERATPGARRSGARRLSTDQGLPSPTPTGNDVSAGPSGRPTD